MKLSLYCPHPHEAENQRLLAQCSDVDWLEQIIKPEERVYLFVDRGQLGIADGRLPKVRPVVVDFLSAAMEHRRRYGGGAGQLVAKAVGLQKKKQLRILDATAGLGRDAYVMSTLGATVLMFERNPVVSLMLRDGLFRLGQEDAFQDVFQRLKFEENSLLGDWSSVKLFHPDVIYLDPMFPVRTKSAKVKKDMALFHEVVGSDMDSDALLEPAMDLADCRVVVKRPKNAPYLAGRKPTTALMGKSSRFDIYSKKAIV